MHRKGRRGGTLSGSASARWEKAGLLTSSSIDAGNVQFVNHIESSLWLAVLVDSLRLSVLSLSSLSLFFWIAS